MDNAHPISATLEDYLEAIFELARDKGAARVRDIAASLSVHKSTVSAALKNLAQKRLINYSPYEMATLTPKGRRIAEGIMQSHKTIQRFLTEVLFVGQDSAEENACRMEHVMDQEVLDRLVLFARFVKRCPRASKDWLARLSQYVARGGRIEVDSSEAVDVLRDFEKRLRMRAKGSGKRGSRARFAEGKPMRRRN